MSDIVAANIAPFPNPANEAVSIHLREVSAAQALRFSGLNPDMEEANLSEFLNEAQLPEHYTDSRTWTAQTRKMAFFWYAIHTLKDTSMSANYTCDHCDNSHKFSYDLRDLADTFKTIKGKDYREITLNGEVVRISSLNGDAMEDLELQRAQLIPEPPKGAALTPDQEKHNREIMAKIRFRQIVISVDFPNDLTEDEVDRFNSKEKRIASLTMTSYKEFCESVYRLQREMDHGLNMAADKHGELHLIVGTDYCQETNKGKEGGVGTVLRIRFRDHVAIPLV